MLSTAFNWFVIIVVFRSASTCG